VAASCCAALALFAALLLLASPPTQADDSEAKRPRALTSSSTATTVTDRLPLKSTAVDVRIAGVIADVAVTQHYRNEGQRPIEARYVFPGSTQAAVHAMNVRIGERLLAAQIRRSSRRASSTTTRRRRPHQRAAGAAPPERLPDERGQHPARRRRARWSCATPSC
jgi:hypothetical protein